MISTILEYGLAGRYRYLQVTQSQGVTAQAVFIFAVFHQCSNASSRYQAHVNFNSCLQLSYR